MGLVIDQYVPYFRAITTFNQRTVESRQAICESYFDTMRDKMPTHLSRLRLDAYAAKFQGNHSPSQVG